VYFFSYLGWCFDAQSTLSLFNEIERDLNLLTDHLVDVEVNLDVSFGQFFLKFILVCWKSRTLDTVRMIAHLGRYFDNTSRYIFCQIYSLINICAVLKHVIYPFFFHLSIYECL
jgi:hypothetical protein